jgi:hypothetical protein
MLTYIVIIDGHLHAWVRKGMHFRFIDPTNYDERRDLVPHISTMPCVLVFPQVP